MSWVPMDTRAKQFLPQCGRQYTELEALFSLQVDYAQGSPATLAGYAAQWRWSRDRVRTWLTALGLQIEGQKGRNPGRLAIKSATSQQTHSDQSATSHLMFHDFGRLGDPQRQRPASIQSAKPQRSATPYIDNTYTSHQITIGCSEVERTKRLLESKFDDSDIPPSPDAIRLWEEWENKQKNQYSQPN